GDTDDSEHTSPLRRSWTTFTKRFLLSRLPVVPLPASIPAQASLTTLAETTLLLPDDGAQVASRWMPESELLSTSFKRTVLLSLHSSIPSKSWVPKTVLPTIVLLSAAPKVTSLKTAIPA